MVEMAADSQKLLDEYKLKRDFSKTPEPSGVLEKLTFGSLTFVVQKHAARRLHYDFRLELDGVLKSWAVPKGPSLDVNEKRMAMMVEDHPLDYGSFEGVIARGNYGAGQVVVWDAGIYSPDEGGDLSFGDRERSEARMREDLEKGKLSFTLRGRKLKGSWTLVKTKRDPAEWLLIKHRDRYADSEREILTDDESVLSGLTIENLKEGRHAASLSVANILRRGRQSRFPDGLKPMSARSSERAFFSENWLFEPKLDGYRTIAFLDRGRVSLKSRTGREITNLFPMVAADIEALPHAELALDGEAVVLNDSGLPDFGLMQRSIESLERGTSAWSGIEDRVFYYAFDLLYVDGVDVRGLPLYERKSLLSKLLVPGEHVKTVDYVERDGESFFEAATRLGLEGIVGKRRDSPYQAGVRSDAWLKIKAIQGQEFVIGGYTKGLGERSDTFGALLLGYYDNGNLRYCGKVGSGFDQASLKELHDRLISMETAEGAFLEDPDLQGGDLHWTKPELVAQVKFSQWTSDGRLRGPVFLGLRFDVEPQSVRRESEAPRVLPGTAVGSVADVERSVEEVSASLLEQLSGKEDRVLADVDGFRLSLTNLNKPLWPEFENRPAVTKRDMIRYYASIGPWLLPHLKDRPLTLTRYPNGIRGQSFYQKHIDEIPDFVGTVDVFSSHAEGDVQNIMVNNLQTLIWLAQLANIEFHAWLSRVEVRPDAAGLSTGFIGSKEHVNESVLNYPDVIVFDLDPYIYSGEEGRGEEPELNRRAFEKTVEVALVLKETLDQLSLSSYLKTSGKTGLHIYVPVVRQYPYHVTRKACELIGRYLIQKAPKDITMEWSTAKRTGKVFLDYTQNVRGKNMASAYSLRPLPGATVSTPIGWEELERVYPTHLNIETVPERVKQKGDLWVDILDAKHDLNRLLGVG